VRVQKREHGPPPGLAAGSAPDLRLDSGEKRDALSDFFVKSKYPMKEGDPNLNDILRRVEQRVFLGTTKAYSAFKLFDADHDGYVSTADMRRKLGEMCILNPKEEEVFMNYLDPNKKGYVDFKDFSHRVKSNMAHNDAAAVNNVIPYTAPCKEIHNATLSQLPEVKAKVKVLQKEASPDNCKQSC
jgi:hypothetical protein